VARKDYANLPKFHLLRTVSDSHFCIGKNFAVHMDIDFEGNLSDGLIVTAGGSLLTDALIIIDHSSGGFYRPADDIGDPSLSMDNYWLTEETSGVWSTVVTDWGDFSRLPDGISRLNLFLVCKAKRAGSGILRMTVNPVANCDSVCEHQSSLTIYPTEDREIAKRNRQLDRLSREDRRLETLTREVLEGPPKVIGVYPGFVQMSSAESYDASARMLVRAAQSLMQCEKTDPALLWSYGLTVEDVEKQVDYMHIGTSKNVYAESFRVPSAAKAFSEHDETLKVLILSARLIINGENVDPTMLASYGLTEGDVVQEVQYLSQLGAAPKQIALIDAAVLILRHKKVAAAGLKPFRLTKTDAEKYAERLRSQTHAKS